jgi:HK97 family phage portal protein
MALKDLLKRGGGFFGARIFGGGGSTREVIRTIDAKTSDPFLSDFFGLTGGGSVSQGEASGLAVAQACISAISQTLASVPLSVYRRGANSGSEKAIDYPLYGVLHDAANGGMTAFELREFLIASILVSGNGYAEIKWNAKGQVVGLEPLEPHNVAVERLESGRLRYKVANWNRASVRVLTQDEVLHVRYRLGRSGFVGQSPIDAAKTTFALALAQTDAAGLQAEKNFRPEGVLSVPSSSMTPAVADLALEKLRRKIERGGMDAGILVLDAATSWAPLAFSSKDSEFMESRKLSNLDICRIWNVPPTVAGIVDGATFSNVEGETRAFVARCLAPMAKRVESAMCQQLLPELSRQSLFIEHDLQGLLRGDLSARYAAYNTASNGGWLSANEIRAFENMASIEGGDEYLRPLNMTPTNTNTPVIA